MKSSAQERKMYDTLSKDSSPITDLTASLSKALKQENVKWYFRIDQEEICLKIVAHHQWEGSFRYPQNLGWWLLLRFISAGYYNAAGLWPLSVKYFLTIVLKIYLFCVRFLYMYKLEIIHEVLQENIMNHIIYSSFE